MDSVDPRPPGGIMETAIYAADVAAAVAFYRDVFGLTVVTEVPGRLAFLMCGQQMLLIFNPELSQQPDPTHAIPRHGATGQGHFCFRASDKDEVAAWGAHFARLGIPVERFQVWQGGTHSVYVRDPAGNSVEVGEAALWGFD